MKLLRVGILGQGRSGHDIHTAALQQMPERFVIAAVADLLPDRRERAEREYGCATTADYHELLARRDLDLVLNALPSHLHPPVTLEILAAGHHALCEKPFARHVSDVDQLIAKAAATGRLLAIFQQSRFSPGFVKIRELIASGILGRIVMIRSCWNGFGRRWDWQTLQRMNGGSLLNTGPHPVDQMLNLLGPDVMPQVHCIMDRALTFGDAEDHVKLLLTAPGRPTIDLEISSCCPYPEAQYQVYGTRGGLSGNTGRLTWKYYLPEEAPPQQLIATPLPGYCSEQLPTHEGVWEASPEQKDLFAYMSRQFYLNLYEAITAGQPLAVPPLEVRRQIAVIEECHRQNPLSQLPA